MFFDEVATKLQPLLLLVTELMWDEAGLVFSDENKGKAGKYPEIFGDKCAKSQVATTVDY